ncbi:hypothetical protein GUI12_04660 [Anaplasmataceae bacterium AB001_6]|nr:hypothetical protein GUI12_04660 [Anaplasmataceae bacterium AB001_6]
MKRNLEKCVISIMMRSLQKNIQMAFHQKQSIEQKKRMMMKGDFYLKQFLSFRHRDAKSYFRLISIFAMVISSLFFEGCNFAGVECVPAFPAADDKLPGDKEPSYIRVYLGDGPKYSAQDTQQGCAALCDGEAYSSSSECSYSFEACKKYNLPTDIELWRNFVNDINQKYNYSTRRWTRLPVITQGGEIIFKISGGWYPDDRYDFLSKAYELQLDPETKEKVLDIKIGKDKISVNKDCSYSQEGSDFDHFHILNNANLEQDSSNLCQLVKGMGLYFLFYDLESDYTNPEPNTYLDGLYITRYMTTHVGSRATEPKEDDASASRIVNPVESEDAYILSIKEAYARNELGEVETYEIPRGYRIYAKVLSDEYFSPSGGYRIQFLSGVGDVVVSQVPPLEQARRVIIQIIQAASERIYKSLIDSSSYQTLVNGMLTLFLSITGLMLLMGLIDNPMQQMMTKILTIIFVAFVASNASWDFFSGTLFRLFDTLISQIIGVIGSAYMPNDYDPTAPFGFIDKVLSDYIFNGIIWGLKMPAIIWSDMFLGILALFVIMCVIAIYCLALFRGLISYLVSIVGINLMIGIIPLCFLGVLFKQVGSLFQNWFLITIRFVLQTIFTFLAIAIFSFGILSYYEKIFGFEACWNNIFTISIIGVPLLSIPSYTPGYDFKPIDFWDAFGDIDQRIKFDDDGHLVWGKVPPRYVEERWYFREFPAYNPNMVDDTKPPKTKGTMSDDEIVKRYGSDLLIILDNVLRGKLINFYDILGLAIFALIVYTLLPHLERVANMIAGGSPFSFMGAMFGQGTILGNLLAGVEGLYQTGLKKALVDYPFKGTKIVGRALIKAGADRLERNVDPLLAQYAPGVRQNLVAGKEIAKSAAPIAKKAAKFAFKVGTETMLTTGLSTHLEDEYNQRWAFRYVDNARAQINYHMFTAAPDYVKVKFKYKFFQPMHSEDPNVIYKTYQKMQDKFSFVSGPDDRSPLTIETARKTKYAEESIGIRTHFLGKKQFIQSKRERFDITPSEDDASLNYEPHDPDDEEERRRRNSLINSDVDISALEDDGRLSADGSFIDVDVSALEDDRRLSTDGSFIDVDVSALEDDRRLSTDIPINLDSRGENEHLGVEDAREYEFRYNEEGTGASNTTENIKNTDDSSYVKPDSDAYDASNTTENIRNTDDSSYVKPDSGAYDASNTTENIRNTDDSSYVKPDSDAYDADGDSYADRLEKESYSEILANHSSEALHNTDDGFDQDNTNAFQDEIREEPTDAFQDEIREEPTNAFQDEIREEPTNAFQDEIREESTNAFQDEIREESTNAFQDEIREESTNAFQDEVREESTDAFSATYDSDNFNSDSYSESEESKEIDISLEREEKTEVSNRFENESNNFKFNDDDRVRVEEVDDRIDNRDIRPEENPASDDLGASVGEFDDPNIRNNADKDLIDRKSLNSDNTDRYDPDKNKDNT